MYFVDDINLKVNSLTTKKYCQNFTWSDPEPIHTCAYSTFPDHKY